MKSSFNLLGIQNWLPNHGNLPHSLFFHESLVEMFNERSRGSCKDRPLVFCASTARAGSAFLAKLLSQSPDCPGAVHEPRPRMIGHDMLKWGTAEPATHAAVRRGKIAAVNARILTRLQAGEVYVETSNMFAKTFADVVLDYYSDVRVVILRRPLPSLLKSFIELGFFGDHHRVWKLWLHDCWQPGVTAPSAVGTSPTQWERILAYLVDIERRSQALAADARFAVVHETWLSRITTVDGAASLFDALAIRAPEAFDLSKENVRPTHKQHFGSPVSMAQCEAWTEEFFERAAREGVVLPTIPEEQPLRGEV